MKIILINPPAYRNREYIREGRCMQTKSSWASLWMPLTLSYVAAVLRQDGHIVKLIDCIAEKMDLDNLKKIVFNFSPKLTIVNTAFPSIKGDMKVATIIKNLNRNIKVTVYGMYPTLIGNEIFEEYKDIDCSVIGEPEWVLKNLSNSFENNESLDKIRGLIFKNGDRIIRNPPQDYRNNDLNDLPFPARDLLNNNAYRRPTDSKKFTLICISRGCPNNCCYCAAHFYYGNKLRKRRVRSVISEIEECLFKYDIKNFSFWCESYALDREYAEQIADEIIKRDLKISWYTRARVDNLNRILLKKMKLAGCKLINLGIESTHQKVLDKARKSIDLENINNAIEMIKKEEINSLGHIIFGLPGDSKETAYETLKYVLHSKLDFAQFYCAVPYPNTDLGKIAKENDWIETEDFSQYHLSNSVMRNESLSTKEIKKLRDYAFRKFYFRPRMLCKMFKEVKNLQSFFYTLDFLKWIKS